MKTNEELKKEIEKAIPLVCKFTKEDMNLANKSHTSKQTHKFIRYNTLKVKNES